MKKLGIVFSNLHDINIREMTVNRTFASVPFGGRYRLIDFVLSSMVNSGVTNVGVITKQNYQSLMDHCGSGKTWDLARKYGGLMILPPFGMGSGNGLYNNRLEALQSIVGFLEHTKEEVVIMSDCDIIANVDYSAVIAEHMQNNADITLIYRKSSEETSGLRGLLDIDKSGRVTKFFFADKTTGTCNFYTNMMVIGREYLLRLLNQARLNNDRSFSQDIFAKSTNHMRIFAYAFNGYFANIDSIPNYFKHSLEMLDKSRRDALFLPESPIFTKNKDTAPTKYTHSSSVSNSMIADGCLIEGAVKNSILFRGVHIARGAVVENCILMQSTNICTGAEIGFTIADKNVVIREKRKLFGCVAKPFYIGKDSVL